MHYSSKLLDTLCKLLWLCHLSWLKAFSIFSPNPQENLVFTVCLQAEFTSLDEQVQWTKMVDIGKPLIAKLDLHRPTRRNSCQQTCLMPHSPSTSPTPSPGAERLLGIHGIPCHHPQSDSPFLHVCEPLHGAAGAYGDSLHNDYAYHYENNSYSPYMPIPSVPIEATEDIEDMQNRFMDSLHLYNQPWTGETGTKTGKWKYLLTCKTS